MVLSHIAYASAFFGYQAISVVYWSLSLEFQYYLLMGLVYPLLVHRRAVRITTLVALGGLALVLPNELVVFRWLFLFELGIVTFCVREGLAGIGEYAAALAVAAVGTSVTLGWPVAVVGVITALLIAFVDLRNVVLLFLGEISYSLYLVHVPIGGRIINATSRIPAGPVTATIAAVTAFGVSILASYVFYRVIERPARAWASRVRYGNRGEIHAVRLTM
jgi:peptidoglycan/LPS O-acetylase OafA/YrhL